MSIVRVCGKTRHKDTPFLLLGVCFYPLGVTNSWLFLLVLYPQIGFLFFANF